MTIDIAVIRFYSVSEEYGWLSNFYESEFDLDGKTWRTSEHYFQAQKWRGTALEGLIRKQTSPLRAARIGRGRQVRLRSDWEKVKDYVMLSAVRAKFEQNPQLKQLLVATGSAKLIEHTESDAYWGDGGDGSGKNMLGQILEKVRSELNQMSDEKP
jgi:N-glycosidase YbiA